MTQRSAEYSIDPQFLTRWSPRSFAATPMGQGEVMQILEAARWAPSASNLQPARFAWGLRDDAAFTAILGGLAASNQTWAKEAATLIVVASKPHSEKEGVSQPNSWHAFDAGAAWMSIALQAQTMGLVAHAMGGFVAADLALAIGLPSGYQIHAVVAIGRQGSPEALPERLRMREMPSSRFDVSQLAGHGKIPV